MQKRNENLLCVPPADRSARSERPELAAADTERLVLNREGFACAVTLIGDRTEAKGESESICTHSVWY